MAQSVPLVQLPCPHDSHNTHKKNISDYVLSGTTSWNGSLVNDEDQNDQEDGYDKALSFLPGITKANKAAAAKADLTTRYEVWLEHWYKWLLKYDTNDM